MKKAIIVALLSVLTPVSAFAGGDSLVSVFEDYCLKQSDNPQTLDRAISKRTDDEQAKYDRIRGQGDNGRFAKIDELVS